MTPRQSIEIFALPLKKIIRERECATADMQAAQCDADWQRAHLDELLCNLAIESPRLRRMARDIVHPSRRGAQRRRTAAS